MSDFFMTLRSKGLKSLSGVTLSTNATGQSDTNISSATISRSFKNCKWLKKFTWPQCQWSYLSKLWFIYLVAKYKFLNVFFSGNVDSRATVGLIKTGLLFPGKVLICGWICLLFWKLMENNNDQRPNAPITWKF